MSKFYVWVDDANVGTVVQSASAFEADTQRKQGFAAGTGASALRVNTALRQSSLITVALVEALGISDSYDGTSTLLSLKSWFTNTPLFKLTNSFTDNTNNVTLKKSILPNATETLNLGSNGNKFNGIYAATADFTAITTNDCYADYIRNCTEAAIGLIEATNIYATNIYGKIGSSETKYDAYFNNVYGASINLNNNITAAKVIAPDAEITTIIATEVVADDVYGNINNIAFSKTTTNILKADEEIIAKKKLLWSGNVNIVGFMDIERDDNDNYIETATTLITGGSFFNKQLEIHYSFSQDKSIRYKLQLYFDRDGTRKTTSLLTGLGYSIADPPEPAEDYISFPKIGFTVKNDGIYGASWVTYIGILPTAGFTSRLEQDNCYITAIYEIIE